MTPHQQARAIVYDFTRYLSHNYDGEITVLSQEKLAANIAAALDAETEACAQIILKYAVNLGGKGEVKPLIEDGRGHMDMVRQAYAAAIRQRKGAR